MLEWRPRARFFRFLLAGGLNTCFGLGAYSLLLLVGWGEAVALLVSILCGIAFNFVSLGRYAFRDLSLRRLPRFIFAYALIYAINLGLLHLLLPVMAGALWRQIVLTPPMAVLSYLLMSRWVFPGTSRR